MVEVDTTWLIEALEDQDQLVHHYLDKQTGEILRVNEMFETQKDLEDTYARMEKYPDRWIAIEPYPSRKAFGVMEEFVSQLPVSERRHTLERALSRERPFSSFRHALSEMPLIREQWFQHHNARMCEIAEEWLRDAGVTAELK